MNWKKGDVIRNIFSGKMHLVLHLYRISTNVTATATVDLEDGSNPTPLLILLERDYSHWVKDSDCDIKNNGEVVKYTSW